MGAGLGDRLPAGARLGIVLREAADLRRRHGTPAGVPGQLPAWWPQARDLTGNDPTAPLREVGQPHREVGQPRRARGGLPRP